VDEAVVHGYDDLLWSAHGQLRVYMSGKAGVVGIEPTVGMDGTRNTVNDLDV